MIRLFCTMSKRIRACFQWFNRAEMTAGKVTLFAILSGAILSASTFFAYFQVFTEHSQAHADNVNTSVTVLNTPPTWVNGSFAHEETPSATTTPTSAVFSRLAFRGTAVDSSADN